MPFAWSGVSVYTGGASVLRVRLRQLPGAGVSLVAADSAGLAVLSVESLVSRPMPVQGAGPLDDLFAVEWVPIPVPVPRRAVRRPRWCTPARVPMLAPVRGPSRCRPR